MPEVIHAWHFLPADGKIANANSQHGGKVVRVGQKLSVTGEINPCVHGLHASERLIDALRYAPGPILCRVECSGTVKRESDKLAARHRKVLAMADVTATLHEFACQVAEEALLREREAGREPDVRCWTAIETKRRWLRGEASNSELQAAWDAAWGGASAASVAARAAAHAAAWDAARAAAWASAWAAAWDAAWDAARAAWDAAWDAARDAQNDRLTALILSLPEFTAIIREMELPR